MYPYTNGLGVAAALGAAPGASQVRLTCASSSFSSLWCLPWWRRPLQRSWRPPWSRTPTKYEVVRWQQHSSQPMRPGLGLW